MEINNAYHFPIKIFSNPNKKWAILDFDDQIIKTFICEIEAKYALRIYNDPAYYIQEIWL